jgi:hypothetical protein
MQSEPHACTRAHLIYKYSIQLFALYNFLNQPWHSKLHAIIIHSITNDIAESFVALVVIRLSGPAHFNVWVFSAIISNTDLNTGIFTVTALAMLAGCHA